MTNMKTVKDILGEADADDRRGRSLLKHASELERKAADLCPHPKDELREGRGSGPPWTICLLCGYAEEGWGIGGWKLPGGYIDHMPIPRISEDLLMRRRRFFRTQADISHETICVLHHGKPKERVTCDGVCGG